MMKTNIDFSSKFLKANLISILFFTMSVLLIFFKGLNFGIDFKGGTLIELRSESKNVNISEIRSSLNSLNLGDVNVKEFGNKGDYLIKVEQKETNNNDLIPNFFTLMSPRFIDFKLSLIKEALIVPPVLNSIKVPPLKSIP